MNGDVLRPSLKYITSQMYRDDQAMLF